MTARPIVESLEPRQLLAFTGTRDLLYVQVRFSDQTAYPESPTKAASVANGATNLITEYSGNQLKFRNTFKEVTLSHDTAYYKSRGTSAIQSDADARLRAAGQSLTGFEHISYRYNGPIGSFAGLGQINGSRTWIKSSSSSVVAHELGHNAGLGHAKFANPNDNTNPFGAASTSEYGDTFSNMGSSSKDWNAHQKWALGWLGSPQVKTIDATRAGTTTVNLSSHDNADTYGASSVYLLRLTLGSSSNAYYLSYRKSPDAVFLHRAPSSRPTGSTLLDAHPNTSTASDAGFTFGQSLTDKRGSGSSDDIKITVIRNGARAQITITVGASTATPTPTTTTTTVATTATRTPHTNVDDLFA